MGPKVSLSSLNDDEYNLKLALKYEVERDIRRLAISVAIPGVKIPPPRSKVGIANRRRD